MMQFIRNTSQWPHYVLCYIILPFLFHSYFLKFVAKSHHTTQQTTRNFHLNLFYHLISILVRISLSSFLQPPHLLMIFRTVSYRYKLSLPFCSLLILFLLKQIQIVVTEAAIIRKSYMINCIYKERLAKSPVSSGYLLLFPVQLQ